MSERPVEINKIKPSDYEMAGLSDIVRDYIFDLEQEIEAWDKLDKENPRLERLDDKKVLDVLYDWQERSLSLNDLKNDLVDTFGQPKDAVRSEFLTGLHGNGLPK